MGAQKHTHTATNRYPGIFRTVQTWFDQTREPDAAPLRILSFGCSSGDEMLTLRAYFPEATIIGCDVNTEMLRRSKRTLRGDPGFTFFSSPKNVDAFGPYDAIFAMSVLCQFPESRSVANLSDIFPFPVFEKLAGNLAKNINPNGIFCLFNSNYLFRHLATAEQFVSLRSEKIHTTGFIDRFAPDGSRLTLTEGNRDAFLHFPEPGADITDDDLIDCLHIRKSDQVTEPQFVTVSEVHEPAGFSADEEEPLAEAPPKTTMQKNGISSQLFVSPGQDSSGKQWMRYCWKKTALDGGTITFQPWFARLDGLSGKLRTPEQEEALAETERVTVRRKILIDRYLSKLRLR